MEEMRLLVGANLHAVVYSALDQVTVNDMRGFYRETGYISLAELAQNVGYSAG